MDVVTLSLDEFRRFAALIREHAGIHLDESKRSLLSHRLRKRLHALNLNTFEEYDRLLQCPQGFKREESHFLSAVTTNETYFFRNDRLWTHFIDAVIPSLVSMRQSTEGGGTLRIWSAACSTGAEAYTAAILLTEHLPRPAAWTVSLIGSDISNSVLDTARAAIFSDDSVSRVSPERLNKWFWRTDDGFQVREPIRKMVRFQFHNLRDPFPNARFDLIFLRNVLMYFDLKMKQCVIENMVSALAPGGYLIVGDVDPVRTIPELNSRATLAHVGPGTYRKPFAADARRNSHGGWATAGTKWMAPEVAKC